MKSCAMFLGIITEKKEEVLDAEIEDMIAARQQAARKAKDFALADEIRGKLLDMGIILEDTREGVKWKTGVNSFYPGCKEAFRAEAGGRVSQYSPLVLAYIGDAVYETA